MTDRDVMSSEDLRVATAHDCADARFAVLSIIARVNENQFDPVWLAAVAVDVAELGEDVRVLHSLLRRAMVRGDTQ